MPPYDTFKKWVCAVLQYGGTVTIRLADLDEAHQINMQFRAKDYATNILSFSYDEQSPNMIYSDQPVFGDLLLCPQVIAREANEQQKTLDAHYAHLVVHGLLHLQGWQHDKPDEAAKMENHEREILLKLGYDDPYSS